MLSKEEILRYSRHLLLPEIGIAGQEKLKKAKVLVIGAGGLGCPALLYLTAAGVGNVGIVDFDIIDESNLQRQILYSTEDVGESKSVVAAKKLRKQNPYVNFIVFNIGLSVKNALDIIKQFDIVVDGSDNFPTRYMINDACVLLNKTLVSASLHRFEGQLSVFNSIDNNGNKGPTYRCLFPAPPSPASSPNCSTIGVLGVLPGIVGAMQANETIKLITGIGETLSGKLFLVDALTMDFNTIAIQRSEQSIQQGPATIEEFLKTNYDYFCNSVDNNQVIKKITANELASLIDEKENLQFLDVREPGEQPEINELIDLQIPIVDIPENADRISRDKKVIVFCRSGARSRHAIELLQKDFNYHNLYNLEGGILKWLEEYQLKS